MQEESTRISREDALENIGEVVNHVERAHRLLASLHETPPAQRWMIPFPMAVFGTLRAGFRNHHLMQLGRIADRKLAFLPHFRARQIDLVFHSGASAPFEVFFYEPADWQMMIEPVERLEGFAPTGPRTGSYHRTLAWLSLLSDDFRHPAYEPAMLEAERDLAIPAATWSEYDRVPCWIYSALAQNQRASERPDSPLIWDDVVYR